MGGLPSGGGLRGGRLRRPGCRFLAAGPAAGPAQRTLRAPGHVVRVVHGAPRRDRHRGPCRHRARARRVQRLRCRVRVDRPQVNRRHPHVLQRYPTPRLHQARGALASAHGNCKFAGALRAIRSPRDSGTCVCDGYV